MMSSFLLPINYKLFVKITMAGAYHSKSDDISPDTDSPLLKDGKGRILLSGATVKGVIRSTLEKLGVSDEILKDIFGASSNKEGEKKEERAGRIYIDDAPSQNALSSVRTHVNIDSKTGTSKEGLLYDNEVAAPQTCFDINITLATDDERAGRDMKVLCLIRDLLSKGFITFGGSSSRGCGFIDPGFSVFKISRLDRRKEEDFIKFLLDKEGDIIKDSVTWSDLFSNGQNHTILRIDYTLQDKDGHGVLISGQEYGSQDRSHYCMYLKSNGEPVPVIPGSSMRGPLRSRASYILSRLMNSPENGKKTVEKIFGHVNEGKAIKSRVAISDLLGKKIGGENRVHVDHIAIDRFTGGTIEGKKFDEEILVNSNFKGSVLLTDPTDEDLNLLAHLIRDAQDGLIRLGHAKSRGLGNVKFTLDNATILQIGKGTAETPLLLKGTQQHPIIKVDSNEFQKNLSMFLTALEKKHYFYTESQENKP